MRPKNNSDFGKRNFICINRAGHLLLDVKMNNFRFKRDNRISMEAHIIMSTSTKPRVSTKLSWTLAINQLLKKNVWDLMFQIKCILKSVKVLRILTYVFSCLIKLEKLLCLKYLGRSSLANSGGFHTMKLLLLWLQDTMGSVEGSSTISYVFAMKGGNELELDGASSILNWVRNNHKHLKFGPLTRNWTYKAF